jgi:DNA-binding NtrC family response regulator
VVTVHLPLLRKRRHDIPELVEHFLTSRQVGLVRCRIEQNAPQALLRYDWPGNVRELANVLERAQIIAEDHVITLDDLPEISWRLRVRRYQKVILIASMKSSAGT